MAPDKADCVSFLSDASGEVTIDDVQVELERFEPVEITFDSSDGALRGFACGLWARIPPLDPGEHRLRVDGRSGTFTTKVTYTLAVS